MKLLIAIPLILAATAIRSAAQTIPLVTDSLSTIDPVEIRFSPLKREITETVIPYLKSTDYGPDRFYLRVYAYYYAALPKRSSIIFAVQLRRTDDPFTMPINRRPFGYCRIDGSLCLFCNELLRQYVGPAVIPDTSDYAWFDYDWIISWEYILINGSLLPIGIW